eukprot:154504-Chlamydomonas_euryale.AAC.3
MLTCAAGHALRVVHLFGGSRPCGDRCSCQCCRRRSRSVAPSLEANRPPASPTARGTVLPASAGWATGAPTAPLARPLQSAMPAMRLQTQ